MGSQISPITHGYTDNHLFKLTYFLQETPKAVIQQRARKPAGFIEGGVGAEGRALGQRQVRQDRTELKGPPDLGQSIEGFSGGPAGWKKGSS